METWELTKTTLAEGAPVLKNLTAVPGSNPGVKILLQSPPPPIRSNPVDVPAFKTPVYGESSVMSMVKGHTAPMPWMTLTRPAGKISHWFSKVVMKDSVKIWSGW